MNQKTLHGSTSLITTGQWSDIRWVLLDMDGTLLDLCYDNAFWREQLPLAYSLHAQIPLQQAKDEIEQIVHQKYGQLEWYSIDFWSSRLGFDIRPAKAELKHMIGFRAGALAFLKWLRHQNKHIILATNAHPDSIALKNTQTDLKTLVDRVLHAHEPGAPKEDPAYWQWLQRQTGFIGEQTLFIDDSDPILDSALTAGVKYCIGVKTPSSASSAKESRYPAFDHFQELYPVQHLL
ncbi:MAG: GMP/IMP nucleotidase [Reinekea sp.]|jgi:5'-nucleotidase